MLTPKGLASVRAKLAARLTAERRRQFAEDTRQARAYAEQARKRAADAFAAVYAPMILMMQEEGLTIGQIAIKLNAAGHRSRRGGEWTHQTIRRVLKRNAILATTRSQRLFSEIYGATRVIGWDRI